MTYVPSSKGPAPLTTHPSVASPITATVDTPAGDEGVPSPAQLAANVIEEELRDIRIDCGRYCLGGSIPIAQSTTDVTEALDAAGLLCTPEERDLLDAVNAPDVHIPDWDEMSARMDARAAVVAAACSETDAEHHAQHLTRQALEAPTDSMALRAADDAVKARIAATAQRRAAVRQLRETER